MIQRSLKKERQQLKWKSMEYLLPIFSNENTDVLDDDMNDDYYDATINEDITLNDGIQIIKKKENRVPIENFISDNEFDIDNSLMKDIMPSHMQY